METALGVSAMVTFFTMVAILVAVIVMTMRSAIRDPEERSLFLLLAAASFLTLSVLVHGVLDRAVKEMRRAEAREAVTEAIAKAMGEQTGMDGGAE